MSARVPSPGEDPGRGQALAQGVNLFGRARERGELEAMHVDRPDAAGRGLALPLLEPPRAELLLAKIGVAEEDGVRAGLGGLVDG
jgi:hypothetical protein